MRTYTLLAKMQNYPSTFSDLEFGYIEIIDPCASPGSIDVTPQVSPPAYYYTGASVIFKMTPFETWPPGCAFTYDCDSVEGLDLDV